MLLLDSCHHCHHTYLYCEISAQDQEYSRLTASLALDAYQWRSPVTLTALPAIFQS